MIKPDPIKLAHDFMNLSFEDFRTFWSVVCLEWNQDDGDLEAQWFYSGKMMRPGEPTVIGAMHSAVLSGQKSGARK